MKNFIAGYRDARIFVNDDYHNLWTYRSDVNVYSLEEVLELPFMVNFMDWVEDKGYQFESLSDKEKTEIILDYIMFDEIANIEHYNTEIEALKRKEEILEELEELEERIKSGELKYFGITINNYGEFVEIYESIENN